MADPRAFISFDYDHDATSKTCSSVKRRTSRLRSFTVADWSSKSSLPRRMGEV